jgi:hypothetical protein
MRERYGVRLGQKVRDLDGKVLGKVTALFEESFAVRGGLPILFRRDVVARYDEVRGERDGVLVLARSDRDLFELAAGEVPTAWKIPAPPDYPTYATPGEARFVFEDVAAGAISREGGRSAEEPGEGAAAEPAPRAASSVETYGPKRREVSPLPPTP